MQLPRKAVSIWLHRNVWNCSSLTFHIFFVLISGFCVWKFHWAINCCYGAPIIVMPFCDFFLIFWKFFKKFFFEKYYNFLCFDFRFLRLKVPLSDQLPLWSSNHRHAVLRTLPRCESVSGHNDPELKISFGN